MSYKLACDLLKKWVVNLREQNLYTFFDIHTITEGLVFERAFV